MNYFWCVLLLLAPLQAYGWWQTGHMLVAQIALKHLNNNSSSELVDSLQNAVKAMVTYTNDSDTFVTAAVWMDDLTRRGLPQFSTWHYINLPVCDFGNNMTNITDSCVGVSVDSVLAGSNNVIWAINHAFSTMDSRNSMGWERAFAIRNLLHFIGDIHQPLHAVSLINANIPTPAGDEGGNLFFVNVTEGNSTDKRIPLHSLWDSGLFILNNYIDRPLNDSASDYLSKMADQIMAETANLTAKQPREWNVTQWALDSRALAIQYAYNISNNSLVSQEYINAAWPIVVQQIGLAGFRLAQVLSHSRECNATTGNCPDLSESPSSTNTYIIALGVILAVSVFVNIFLTYTVCKKSSHSEETTPLRQ